MFKNVSKNSFRRTLISITFLCSLYTHQVWGQATTVEFVVDLQFAPLSGNQVIVLRGSSATLGRWHGGDLMLSPNGNNLFSTTVSFPDRDLNQLHFYKFAILDENDVRWESRPSRSFILSSGHKSLDPVLFNDLDRPALTEELELVFTLDMDAYPGERPSAIGLAGTSWPLGEIVPDELVLMTEEEGAWQVRLFFEAGTPADLAFSFYFEIDGHWQAEGRRHAVMLNNNHPSRTIEMTHNGSVIVPASRVRDLMTDNFQNIAGSIGESGKRYLLDAALQHLESGHLSQAADLYNLFIPYLATVSDEERLLLQDVFPIRYGQALYRAEQKTQAINYLGSKEKSALTPARKASYAHALAAAQQAAGDLTNALASYNGIESGDAAEASALGYGITQLRLGAYASGTQQLESIEGTRRMAALRAAGYAHADSANYNESIEAFDILSHLGTDAEQVKAYLLKLEVQLRAGQLDEALAGVEALLSDERAGNEREEKLRHAASNRYRKAHLIYLKALILEHQGHDPTTLFQHVITNYPDTKYAARAQRRISSK